MDAVKRAWRVFRILVFRTPVVSVVLSLFYGVAAFLVATGAGRREGFWLGIAVICAIPTGGIFALASERIVMLCSSTAELIVPRHVATVRIVQGALVALFVCAPILLIAALPGEGTWTSAVILMVAAALGTTLMTHKWVGAVLVVAFLVLGRTDSLGTAFSNAYVLAGLFVGAIVLLYRWFLLPGRVELQGSQAVARLADATHEATDEALSATFDPAALGSYEKTLSGLLRRAREEMVTAPGGTALALGLGFEHGVHWMSWLKWTGAGALALLAWHFLHGRHSELLGYWGITAIAGLTLMSRTGSVLEAWRRTSEEQSVLKLTPRWPDDRQLKRVFVSVIVQGQLGAWLGWGVLAAVCLLLGVVTPGQLATGAFVLLGASCGCAGGLGMLLARRSLKEWHFTTIFAALSAIVGVVIFAARPPAFGAYPIVIGLVLVLLPLALGLAAMFVRPLLFPVVHAQAGR